MKRGQFYTLPIWMFPVILTTGILTIPVVTDYSNHVLAEQAASQTARWFWGHIISATAFGFAILAACSIASHLVKKGQRRSAITSLSLVAIGGILYAVGLGADGIGPLATVAGGGQALMFFEGSGEWVSGIFITASIIFGIGLITQVTGLIQAGLLTGLTRIIIFLAAIIFIGAGAIPSGWGLYGVAAAAMVVYIPIGLAVWQESIQE